MRFTYAILLVFSIFIIIACDNGTDSNDDTEHARAVGLVIYSSGTTVVDYERDEAVSGQLEVPAGERSDHFDIKFIDEDGDEFEPEDDHYKLDWSIGDTSLVAIWQHEDEAGGWEFHLDGKKAGETTIRFKVMHDDHADFTSKLVPVVVSDASSNFR